MRYNYLFWGLSTALIINLSTTTILSGQGACQDSLDALPVPNANQLSVSTDKLLYEVNESIVFRIRSNVSGPCDYVIQEDDLLPALQTGTADLIAGTDHIVSFTSAQANFVGLTATQGANSAQAVVAVDACSMPSLAYEPIDFDHFWDSLKNELAQVPINPVLIPSPINSSDLQTTYKMILDNIDGKKVYGWISIPTCPGPFPAIVTFPPFGSDPINTTFYDAIDGAIGISLSIHDYDCELPVPDTIAYYPTIHFHQRHTNVFKTALTGCLRAIDYLFTRPDFNGVHVMAFGISQGGALSLMTAALDKRVKYVCQGIPPLCSHAAFAQGRASGFPNWLYNGQLHGAATQTLIEETGYYDVVNFAKRYKGPSYNFFSYNDPICPPSSVMPAYNQLTGRTTIVHGITSGHGSPPGFWATERSRFFAQQNIPFSRKWEGCPMPPPRDTIAPAAVQQLFAVERDTHLLRFSFMATGDDLDTGTAYRYELRYSTNPITPDNFEAATPAPLNIYPFAAGQNQTYTLAGLAPATTYYFAIRATDESDNIGPITVAEATTETVVSAFAPAVERVVITPNPFTSTLHLWRVPDHCNIQISNVWGQILWQSAASGHTEIAAGTWPGGVYIVTLEQSTGLRRAIRVVKQ